MSLSIREELWSELRVRGFSHDGESSHGTIGLTDSQALAMARSPSVASTRAAHSALRVDLTGSPAIACAFESIRSGRVPRA